MSVAWPCVPPSGWWIMIREFGSAERLPFAPAASSTARHAGRLAHAQRGHVGLDELHRVVDREPGRDRRRPGC